MTQRRDPFSPMLSLLVVLWIISCPLAIWSFARVNIGPQFSTNKTLGKFQLNSAVSISRQNVCRSDNVITVASTCLMIGTGFSFDDGEQVLVSVQKPLGIVLEQDENECNGSDETLPGVVVAEIDPSGSAAQAGVQVGDVLMAVQNASVQDQSLEYVMEILGKAPRVINLRFLRV